MKPGAGTSLGALQTLERKPRLADRVADSILEAIRSQELKPGATLPPERELCVQFGVSRTVIREAIRSLSGKGLLEVVSGSGVRVVAVDASTVSESMRNFVHGGEIDDAKVDEVRRVIEVAAAGLAAQRATAEEIAQIEASVAATDDFIGDLEAYVEADLAFRRALALATHNELFVVLHDSIGEALVEVRRRKLALGPGQRRQCAAAHRRILEAVQAHDPSAARQAMRAHLRELRAPWSDTHATVTDEN